MKIFKPSLRLKAEAELELRRRQQERAATCYMCEVLATIDESYGSADSNRVCDHNLDQQDIKSRSNQDWIARMESIYGEPTAGHAESRSMA